jgi:hypothetical protein
LDKKLINRRKEREREERKIGQKRKRKEQEEGTDVYMGEQWTERRVCEKERNRSKKGREEQTEKLVCLESGKIRIKRGKFQERGGRERERERKTERGIKRNR